MKTFNELWPLPIPEIIVVTGGFGVGKSTFTLGTGATPERTIVIDFEKSQKSFAAQLPLTYVDMQSEMGRAFPQGYKAIDLFKKTCEKLDAIEPGQYDVIVLDNASNLEDGIVAWVEANPVEFGHSQGQYNSMSGLKWGDVKNKYQQILTRWVSKAKMIFIVVHLRDKWVGNSIVKDPFGRPVQEPKGKETLDQLSSLFVWLEAGPGAIPAARVLKCRIDQKVFVVDPENPPADIPKRYIKELNGEPGLVSVPILPLRMPKCTWPAIREYMRHPADLTHPKEGEVPTESQMNEDDRLKLRAIISQAEAEKANSELAMKGVTGAAVEQKTQSVLLQYGRTLNMEPTEVGDALKARNLVPFNPSNWEQMKAAVREFADKKQAVAKGIGKSDDSSGKTDSSPETTPTPAIDAIRDPETVRQYIESKTRENQGKNIDPRYRSLILPTLSVCFAGKPDQEKKSLAMKVAEFLTGYGDLESMPAAPALALYGLLRPYKGASGGWLPNDNALAEIVKIAGLVSDIPALLTDPSKPTTPAVELDKAEAGEGQPSDWQPETISDIDPVEETQAAIEAGILDEEGVPAEEEL